jgi:hypothetical protein
MEKKIKAQDLVDFLKTKMTAEEALLRLLATTIEHYQKLKLEKQPEDNPEAISPYMIIIAATLDLGWDFAIEGGDNSKILRGLSIGTEDYFKSIFGDEQDSKKQKAPTPVEIRPQQDGTIHEGQTSDEV